MDDAFGKLSKAWLQVELIFKVLNIMLETETETKTKTKTQIY